MSGLAWYVGRAAAMSPREMMSNETHLRRAVDLVIAGGRRKVGLSFTPGTDDLRESPMVEPAERLIGTGFDVKIHTRLWFCHV